MQGIKQENYIDKSKWSRGEWDSEPDRMEWRSETNPSFPCLIVRGPSGALCGYVGVPESHPFFWKEWIDGDINVDTHCGLTYSDACQEEGKICHTPLDGESDKVWWLGFDCAHAGDHCPSYNNSISLYEIYRNLNYVVNHVNDLAAQLAAHSATGEQRVQSGK